MDTAQLIATLMGAGGAGAVVLALVNGLIKWFSGAAGRERVRNTDLVTQRMVAIEERDAAVVAERLAAQQQRKLAEYASTLRRQLIEAGIKPIEWPTTGNISTSK